MTLDGPLHGDFYLTFDAEVAARADGGDVRLRVIGRAGYPHDVRVTPQTPGKLHAGRVFAPVVAPGQALRLEPKAPAAGRFVILCANCFAEIHASALGAGADAAEVRARDEAFWSAPSQPGCPRCHAAAARAH